MHVRALACQPGDLEVAEAALLGLNEVSLADVVQGLGLEPLLRLMQLSQLIEEPGVNLCALKQLIQGHAVLHGLHRCQKDSAMPGLDL